MSRNLYKMDSGAKYFGAEYKNYILLLTKNEIKRGKERYGKWWEEEHYD